jgi:hypothetical protein
VGDALTPPFAVAAVVLCVAGLTKLRSPAGAVRALDEIRLPVPAAFVRAFAVAEVGLAAWCVIRPGVVPAAVLASVYAGFAVLALLFARQRTSCGCFGEHEAPASSAHSCMSAALAAVVAASAIWPAHGASWLLARSAGTAVALSIGIAGAAYATVLIYTELPLAWSAWVGGPS